MKLEDYVRKSIWEYPSLYKDVDYAKSRLKVLNQVFFTLGNGLELAHTKDPEKGGYYVHPRSREVNGDWVRCLDKPYGKVGFPPLPADFFDVPIYYLYEYDIEAYTVKRGGWGDSSYVRLKPNRNHGPVSKLLEGMDGGRPRLTEAKAYEQFRPYPFCTTHTVFGDLREGGFLQPDWMEGLNDACRAALEYYQDPLRTATDCYHPSRSTPDTNRMFKEYEEMGPDQVRSLRKTWGWPDGDTAPTESEVWEKAEKSWATFMGRQILTLETFLCDGTVINPVEFLPKG